MSTTIRAEIIATLRGVAPTEDPRKRYTCDDDASGARVALEDAVDNGAYRRFDLRSLGSIDLGMTGVTVVRYREDMEVRVGYYARGADMARLDRIMAQDARDIILTLRNPANYGSADALIPGREAPVVAETENGLIMSVPVTAVYVQ